MQLKKHITTLIMSGLLLAQAGLVQAGKTYTEDEFLNAFSGKMAKVVVEKLGTPAQKKQAVKPSNANQMTTGMVKGADTSKPVHVEMWYYKNLVKYDPKHTYKETEVTIVNDRVMNIAFFNNK